MTDKLCPFCGSELEIIKFSNMAEQGVKIYEYAPCCKNEECIARNEEQEDYYYHVAGYATPEEATAAWNTRPLEDKLTARIAELETKLKELHKYDWHEADEIPEHAGWYDAIERSADYSPGTGGFYYENNPEFYLQFKENVKLFMWRLQKS